MGNKRLIGLTGGIGTGKTAVSRYLAHTYNVPVLDADIYSRDAVKPGSPILKAIFAHYGESIQSPDGTLNRQRLGEIIFNNPPEKQWLESQIHPYVRQCFESQIQQLDRSNILLVIPLLFEANMTDLVTEIWVVFCEPQIQINRLIQRDGLTQEQAITRIKNQLPLEKKIAAADVVLDNSSDLDNLYSQVDSAFQKMFPGFLAD